MEEKPLASQAKIRAGSRRPKNKERSVESLPLKASFAGMKTWKTMVQERTCTD